MGAVLSQVSRICPGDYGRGTVRPREEGRGRGLGLLVCTVRPVAPPQDWLAQEAQSLQIPEAPDVTGSEAGNEGVVNTQTQGWCLT